MPTATAAAARNPLPPLRKLAAIGLLTIGGGVLSAAVAPLLFGALSEWLGGGQGGLMWTFLIMLAPMLLASFLGVSARKTYLRDVATAAASTRACKS